MPRHNNDDSQDTGAVSESQTETTAAPAATTREKKPNPVTTAAAAMVQGLLKDGLAVINPDNGKTEITLYRDNGADDPTITVYDLTQFVGLTDTMIARASREFDKASEASARLRAAIKLLKESGLTDEQIASRVEAVKASMV